jgi:hypothetical protein
MAVTKIIENDDVFASVQKLDAGMRADVPGAASHQDHSTSLAIIAHGVIPNPGGKLLDMSIVLLM